MSVEAQCLASTHLFGGLNGKFGYNRGAKDQGERRQKLSNRSYSLRGGKIWERPEGRLHDPSPDSCTILVR